jgi:hypothetical protein
MKSPLKNTLGGLKNLLYFAINLRPNIGTVDCRKVVEVAGHNFTDFYLVFNIECAR